MDAIKECAFPSGLGYSLHVELPPRAKLEEWQTVPLTIETPYMFGVVGNLVIYPPIEISSYTAVLYFSYNTKKALLLKCGAVLYSQGKACKAKKYSQK